MTRNMILYWTTDTMATVTDVIFSMALVLAAVTSARTALQSGIILFAASVPYVAFGLIGGVLADRFDKRRTMITCDIIRAACIGAIPVAAAGHFLTFDLLIGSSALTTTARTVYFPARKSWAPHLLQQTETLGRFNLYLNASASLGAALAPALGSLVILWTHQVADVFYIPVVSLLVSAISTTLIEVSQPPAIIKKSFQADLTAGLRQVFSSKSPLPYLFIAFALQIIAGSGVTQLILPHLLDTMRLPRNASYGFVLAIMGVAETGMSLLWSRGPTRRSPTWIFVGYFLRVVSFGLFLAALSWDSVVLLFGATILLGAAMPIVGPPFTTILQQSTPALLMGKVLAIRSTIGNVSDAGSYLLTGWLLGILPLGEVLGLATSLAALSTTVFFVLWSGHNAKSAVDH